MQAHCRTYVVGLILLFLLLLVARYKNIKKLQYTETKKLPDQLTVELTKISHNNEFIDITLEVSNNSNHQITIVSSAFPIEKCVVNTIKINDFVYVLKEFGDVNVYDKKSKFVHNFRVVRNINLKPYFNIENIEMNFSFMKWRADSGAWNINADIFFITARDSRFK